MCVRNKKKLNISHINSGQCIVSKDMRTDALRNQLRNICTSVRMEMIRFAEDLHIIEKMIVQDTLNKKIAQTLNLSSKTTKRRLRKVSTDEQL